MMSNKTSLRWLPTNNRFIIYLDILGFKELVIRNPHSKIYKILSDISDLTENIKNAGIIKDIDGESLIKVASFSDSIILFTKDNSNNCFKLISLASQWLFANAIIKSIPLKGAIAYGELSINTKRQIYFGQPLIDAYQLEEELYYYGIVAHNSIIDYIYNNVKTDSPILKVYIECPTPFKSGMINHKNINWFNALNDDKDKLETALLFYMDLFSSKISGKPKKYVDNTIKVYNSFKKLGQLK